MISLIFCHHKGRLIDRAIETALKSRKIEFEIIVATSDPTFSYNHPVVKVVQIEGGPAKKRNLALRYSIGEYIAFYDDDVELDMDSLVEMYHVLIRPEVGMVFGKLLNMEHRDRFDEAGGFLTWTGFIWSRAENNLKDVGQYENIEPVFSGKSAACMIKRKVLTSVGAFDTTFGILGEETDLAWRVWLSGYQVLFVPRSVTWHAFNTKFKPIDFYTHERVYYNGCRNYITMLASNLETKNLWKILPIHIICWIVAGTGMFFKGKFRAAFFIFRGLLSIPHNISWIKIKREKVASIRKLTDKELFKTIYRKVNLGYYLNRLFRYWQIGLHG